MLDGPDLNPENGSGSSLPHRRTLVPRRPLGHGFAASSYFRTVRGRHADFLAGLLFRQPLRLLAPDGPPRFAVAGNSTKRWRKALQRPCLGQEFQRLAQGHALTPEIQ